MNERMKGGPPYGPGAVGQYHLLWELRTLSRDGLSPSSSFLPVSRPLQLFPEPERLPRARAQAIRDQPDKWRWSGLFLGQDSAVAQEGDRGAPLGWGPNHPPSPAPAPAALGPRDQSSSLHFPMPHRPLWTTAARTPNLGVTYESDFSLPS